MNPLLNDKGASFGRRPFRQRGSSADSRLITETGTIARCLRPRVGKRELLPAESSTYTSIPMREESPLGPLRLTEDRRMTARHLDPEPTPDHYRTHPERYAAAEHCGHFHSSPTPVTVSHRASLLELPYHGALRRQSKSVL